MTGLARRQSNKVKKEERILAAALKVFSETGYSGASMDAIASEAGVSKPTLYQYFGAKDHLFNAMMRQERHQMLAVFMSSSNEGMVAELHAFAWQYANTVMRPEFLSLARLIIGEAQRFPEIGEVYQSSGPDKVLQAMMTFLNTQKIEGKLEFEDAELAAQDLWGLILSAPRTQALQRPDKVPGKDELSRYINNGLRVFLKAYSTSVAVDHRTLEEIICKAPGKNKGQKHD